MELSDEDVGLASQNTAPKKVELSDADVFGAPAQPTAELSDADVFGAPAPAQAPLPRAGLGTFADSVGRSYNEFYVQRGLADRVRIEGMLRELDAGGNPDINPVKTLGDGIKMDIGRALGANVETPEVKRQYLLNRLGQIDQEIKSSDSAVKAYGQGSQQLSDLQAGLQEAQKQDSFLSKTGSALSALYNNPAGIPELIGGGAYTMGRPIAAGIGAAALSKGRTLVPMVSSAAVSGADSYDGTMAEIIEQKGREGGIDVRKNPEAIPTLLQDAGFIEAAKGEALRRGISDAAWSAISMRLGMSPKIKGVWQPIVQSGAEVTTELSGQLAQKGEVYDPTALPVAGVAGFAFEGPSYALGRAAGVFGKPAAPAAPGAPAAPQAEPTTPTPAPAPVAAAPDVINVDDLPDAPRSVAGETEATPPSTPAPAQANATPEWLKPVEPAATQPQPEPAPAQPQAAPAAATQAVDPRPKTPDVDAPQAEWDAYWPVSKEWDAKHGKTHWNDGTPKRAEWVKGTPEYEAREARAREVEARRAAEQQAQAATPPVEQPAQPAAPAPVAVEPEATPAPAPQPVATAQPAAPAQTEIAGTEDTFNLTGEQVAAPTTRAEDTTAEMPLEGAQENPLATEARARLAKLEAAGKGDSDQAKALRRTIERETKPAAPAAQPAAQAEPEAQTEPATIPSTPEREAKINAILDNAEAADQSYTYEIKPIYQLKGSDGKWYRPQGFPFGIKNTGEKRIEGYAAHNKDGISYGKVFATDAEAQTFQEDGRKARREEFRKSLEQSDDARLDEQAKFWEGERATFDRRNPEAAARRQKPAQPNVRTDAENTAPQSPQAEAAPVEQQPPEMAPPRKKIEPAPEFRMPKMPAADKLLIDQASKDPSKREAARAAMDRWKKRVEEAQKKHDAERAAWMKRNGLDNESAAARQAENAALRAEVEAKQPQPQQTQEEKDAENDKQIAQGKKTPTIKDEPPFVRAARMLLAELEDADRGDSVEAGEYKYVINELWPDMAKDRASKGSREAYKQTMAEATRRTRESAERKAKLAAMSTQERADEMRRSYAEVATTSDEDTDSEPAAEQPKAVQPAAKADPTISEAAKAQKTDQPQTKRARTALRNAIRQFGRNDKRTERKYRAVLDALEREAYRDKSARDISQPYLGRKEPADVTAARQLLAKKAKATGGISGYDVAKANSLIEQYEAEVDLSQGQLRDEGQIRLVSDETLDRVIAHVQDMIDAGKRPDADAQNAFDLATEERQRRENESTEGYGDPIADVRGIARRGVGIPLLPTVRTERGETAFAGTEYAALAESLPPELSKEGGLFVEPAGGVDVERARKDATYRNELRIAAEGMMEKLSARLIELGWTQLEGDSMGVIQLLQDAAMGRAQIPEGGVNGANFKGDPNTVAKAHGGDINLDALGSEGQVNTDEEADTREPEPSEEELQDSLQVEVDYGNPRYDAQPDSFTETLLAEAEAQGVSEQSILEMLDNAAAERLDPRNRNSLGPDLIAALVWQTARDIQKGVVSFAKWSADMAKKFPSLKGSLKAIWAKAQDVAKRPMDYIRFRALDSIADKVWQNAGRNPASATLRKIANIVFAKAGPDADATENDIPTRINLVRNQFSNIYAGIMERFAREFADMTPEQRRKWDADFRAAVIDGTTPSDPKVAQAVKDFRNLMRDLLAYQRNAGIEMGDQGGNYFPRNYDADAVEADRDGFVAAAQEMYRKREERLLNKAIADVRRAEKDRPAERRAADRKFGRKEKTDAEYQQEAAEWAQEKIAALEAEFDAKDDAFYKQKAEDWATAITHGDVLGMTLFKTTEGKVTSDSTDARTFTNDEAKLADAFLKKNIDDIMMGYIDGAVRGAEVGRIFGQDGSKFEQMMNQLSKEGVDKETIKETRRLVQKALGVGREQQSQATAAFFDWVNVVLAGAFLGKTFMYNLVLEPISFGIRTGNAYLALKSMADTWRYTIAELSTPSAVTRQRIEAKYGSQAAFAKAVTETVAEQVGLIQNEMERAYLNSHWDYSSDEKGSKMAKWISQRIYRANLMSATEKAKVRASIGIARLALRDNARFFTGDAPIQKLFGALGFDTKADKSAAVILRENGVPDADHKAFAAWVAGLEGKTDAEWQKAVMDPKDAMAKHYRRALQRMSLGMSIKTNPALKMEMSDSVLGRLMMQLMNYSYAYSNLVKDRMYSMAAQTVAKDASTIDRLRYAAPLLVGAPLAILGAAASKALIAGIWPSDDEEKRSKETPMVRKAFNWASFAGMFGPKVEYLFKSFERGQAPGGPVGETIFRGGQAVFSAAGDPDSEKKAFNAKKQLYNSTVKPVVTGAGAAVHPFFGFLGNAAVNTQAVRESVTGEQPRK